MDDDVWPSLLEQLRQHRPSIIHAGTPVADERNAAVRGQLIFDDAEGEFLRVLSPIPIAMSVELVRQYQTP